MSEIRERGYTEDQIDTDVKKLEVIRRILTGMCVIKSFYDISKETSYSVRRDIVCCLQIILYESNNKKSEITPEMKTKEEQLMQDLEYIFKSWEMPRLINDFCLDNNYEGFKDEIYYELIKNKSE